MATAGEITAADAAAGNSSDAAPATSTDSASNKSIDPVNPNPNNAAVQPQAQTTGNAEQPQGQNADQAQGQNTNQPQRQNADEPSAIGNPVNAGNDHDHYRNDPHGNPYGFVHNRQYHYENAEERQARRRLVRKYDFYLMPTCFVVFLFFFLDKSSIAFARINGLEKDLHLTNHQFNTALAIFFALNLIFIIPGNLVLRRIGGRLWLSLLIVAWGTVTISAGFVEDFIGLCINRAFLGLTESSFLGGVLLYLGFFYTRDELVLRVGIFYSSSSLAGAIGGLLASGLGNINFKGFNGWPWIFFVEGGLTVILGFAAFAILPNTPRDARFLTPHDRPLALERMRAQDHAHHVQPGHRLPAAIEEEPALQDAAVPQDKLELAIFKRAVCNFLTIAMSIGAFFAIQSIYSFSLFLPTIIAAMGHQAQSASLMAVGPNFLGFVFTLLFCIMARRTNNTLCWMAICAAVSAIGYIVLLRGGITETPETQYAGTFLVAMGVSALPPLALAWMTVNASPHYIRAIALGFMLTIGNLAAFLASFTYIKTDAPWYITGHIINLACAAGLVVVSMSIPIWMTKENKKRQRGERDYRLDPARYNGLTKEEYELQLGWLHPRYRFKY